MGKGAQGQQNSIKECLTWTQIKENCSDNDKLIVIDGYVYNVAKWMKKHPGGARIIGNFVGQDATEAWNAMHDDKESVRKYLKPLLVGEVKENAFEKNTVQEDFEKLRLHAQQQGWFKVNPLFFIAQLAHIIGLELFTSWMFCYFGTGWLQWIIAGFILATVQAQAGWTQHDYGHQSVFRSTRINHAMHHFTIGFIKGASSRWWNFRHFLHHTKPNVIRKDPDVSVPYLFLLGDKMPVSWAKKKRGFMPYNQQHNYFAFLGPSILLTVYFHLEVSYFVFKRHHWMDLAMVVGFFTRWDLLFRYPTGMSVAASFGLYMFTRFLESWWFTMVTQMNHIPMVIDDDHDNDWLTSQTISTCNVEGGLFNDWFTGHLNYQIEHHLFPTMPRHNYEKVAPLVQDLCKKHGKPYVVKSLPTAFIDIFRSLKKSGRLWFEAYYQM